MYRGRNIHTLRKTQYLEVPDEGSDATVRLVVMLLMGKLLQLRQEGDGVPRCEEGQQVRR